MPSKIDIVDTWLCKSKDYLDDSFGDLHSFGDLQDLFSSDQSFSLVDYLQSPLDDDSYMTTNSLEKNIFRYDCMWTGCDEDCRKTHSVSSALDIEKFAVWPTKLGCSFDSESCIDDYIEETSHFKIHAYTPNSDHCYSQPKRVQHCEETSTNSPESVDSDSVSDSSDDEVDVVTVTEECIKPVVRKTAQIKRTVRRKKYIKKQTRNKPSVESTVKAAASALKRSRYQSPTAAKRRRTMNSVETSPSSSLPSSCGSSRCSSDVEDFEKRNTHNDSERKRREAQRTALQMLRVSIPALQSNPKAPKVLILNTATKLIKELQTDNERKKEISKKELKRKKQLMAKLNMLRKS